MRNRHKRIQRSEGTAGECVRCTICIGAVVFQILTSSEFSWNCWYVHVRTPAICVSNAKALSIRQLWNSVTRFVPLLPFFSFGFWKIWTFGAWVRLVLSIFPLVFDNGNIGHVVVTDGLCSTIPVCPSPIGSFTALRPHFFLSVYLSLQCSVVWCMLCLR